MKESDNAESRSLVGVVWKIFDKMMNKREYMNEVRIRAICDSDSIDELTGLLNRAHKQHAGDGLLVLASHQAAHITPQIFATGTCFVAKVGDKIAGTITYNFPYHVDAHQAVKQVRMAGNAQPAVEPAQRGRGTGRLLMSHAECSARRDGADELVLDTAEAVSSLITWYWSLAYQIVSSFASASTNYRRVIVSKHLRGESCQ